LQRHQPTVDVQVFFNPANAADLQQVRLLKVPVMARDGALLLITMARESGPW
jgi:hypothetical protein